MDKVDNERQYKQDSNKSVKRQKLIKGRNKNNSVGNSGQYCNDIGGMIRIKGITEESIKGTITKW